MKMNDLVFGEPLFKLKGDRSTSLDQRRDVWANRQGHSMILLVICLGIYDNNVHDFSMSDYWQGSWII